MIADPLWSCVMLLCGPLCSFAVFSHTPFFTLVWHNVWCKTGRSSQSSCGLHIYGRPFDLSQVCWPRLLCWSRICWSSRICWRYCAFSTYTTVFDTGLTKTWRADGSEDGPERKWPVGVAAGQLELTGRRATGVDKGGAQAPPMAGQKKN